MKVSLCAILAIFALTLFLSASDIPVTAQELHLSRLDPISSPPLYSSVKSWDFEPSSDNSAGCSTSNDDWSAGTMNLGGSLSTFYALRVKQSNYLAMLSPRYTTPNNYRITAQFNFLRFDSSRNLSDYSSAQYWDNIQVYDLTPSYSITIHLPLVMNNYCAPFTISDPYFSFYQSDMRQINADDAWLQCAQGDPGIVVAIIDTGVNLSHPDLAPNLIPGASFVSYEPSVEDGQGHGSNVAGIVGAALNGIGVIGVAPSTHLLPVKVLDSTGSGYTSWVASGITFAADRANVLNLSLGGTADSTTLRNAINYAADTRGRLVVAAAGNCGDPNYYRPCDYVNQLVYPGAYPNVMAVAAVDSTDSRASFSNQGAYVDIAAPGVSIYNTYKNGSYIYESGTSQATPHVAGLAALIWARYRNYTAAQVRALIENTAVDLGTAGWDQQFGWGRIDASAALGLTYSGVTPLGQAKSARVELPAPVDHRGANIAPGRVLSKFQPGLSAASTRRTLGAFSSVSVESQIEALDVQVLRVPVGQEWSYIDQLRALPGIEYAEPDYAVQLIQ